jgi:tetratricopeptide (TPR) repeat protein
VARDVTSGAADGAAPRTQEKRIICGPVPALADCLTDRPQSGPSPVNEFPGGQCLVLSAPRSRSAAGDVPGGTGKTQLAALLARDWLRAHDDGVLAWIDAGSRDLVLSGYARAAAAQQGGLAAESGRPDAGTAGTWSAADAQTTALRFLARLAAEDRPWLVVVDGLSDPADMDGLWPSGPSGRVLVTTLDPAAVPESQRPLVFPVGPFSAHEALTYLMARLSADPERRLGAVDLADDLAGDPLALTQASAAIGASGVSCRDYRDIFAKRREELTGAGGRPPAPNAVTWTLSVECAAELTPGGVTQPLLVLTALLGPHGIPEEVLATRAAADFAASRAAGTPGPGLIPAALASLRASGLLTVAGGLVLMHPAVRAQVLAVTPEQVRAAAAEAAADALIQAWPDGDEGTGAGCALRACAASLNEAGGEALWAAGSYQVLYRAGNSLDAAGLSGPAVAHWRAVAAASERRLGAAHEDSLLAATRLASAALAAGRAADAAEICRRVLDTQASQLGTDHPRTIAARADYGTMLRHAGQAADSIVILEGVLAGGGHHSAGDFLAISESLAASYQAAGRQPEAMRLLERTLAERERRQGPDDPQTIRTRRALALACLAGGKGKDAIAHGRRAVAGAERVLGPGHPDTLDAVTALASAYHAARRLRDAIGLYEGALASLEQARGADAPETIGVRGNLASAYHSAGRLATALELYERTRADCQRVLGADHPDTLAARANLAHAHYALGRVAEATALLRAALADCERVLPPADPLTQAVRESLTAMADA